MTLCIESVAKRALLKHRAGQAESDPELESNRQDPSRWKLFTQHQHKHDMKYLTTIKPLFHRME